MANTNPCQNCEHFDPVMRGQTARGGLRETAWGWCARRSVYPYFEGPGQRFPPEVARAEPGQLAQPVIVKRSEVVTHCTLFEPRTVKASKADLLKQLNGS